MGKCKTFFLWACVFYFAGICWHFSLLFRPELCSGKKARDCFRPLFPVAERLDLYVYSGTEVELDASTFGRLAHVWNATNISAEAQLATWVNVTLPDSVRRNGSLHAHIFLVRAGLSPDPTQHTDKQRPYDWMYASASLTQLCRQTNPGPPRGTC